MAVDYEKAKELYNQGLDTKKIAKKLKCTVGTLNNNSKKWKIRDDPEINPKEAALEVIERLEPYFEREEVEVGEIITDTTEKEILKVKQKHKRNSRILHQRIDELIGKPFDEDTGRELNALTKLIDILSKAQKYDWAVHDILEYRDVIQFEMAIKKLELLIKGVK